MCRGAIISIAEPEPRAEAATFRVEPEPRAEAAFFNAAPAASFWHAKKESLVVVTKDDLAIYNGKCDPKNTCINNSLQSSK